MLNKIIIYTEKSGKSNVIGYNHNHQLEYFLVGNTDDLNTESIYMGRVDNINYKNHTAFVNFCNTIGFVNVDKSHKLQAGSIFCCQIRHLADVNEIGDHNIPTAKQIKLSTDILHIGRYIILTKGGNLRFHCQDKYIDRLKGILEQYLHKHNIGIIFRTSINNLADLSAVEEELLYLINKKSKIDDLILKKSGIECLDDGIPFYLKFIRDSQYADDLEIITNDDEVFNQISLYVNMWQIDKLSLDKTYQPNYSDIKLEHIIKKDSFSLELHKLSGINLIDVNSSNAKLSFFKVNYLALDEIMLQIKLWDLTGIILLDLIKNMSVQEQQQITNKLIELIKDDWRNNKMLGFTKAGIVEIIRNH